MALCIGNMKTTNDPTEYCSACGAPEDQCECTEESREAAERSGYEAWRADQDYATSRGQGAL